MSPSCGRRPTYPFRDFMLVGQQWTMTGTRKEIHAAKQSAYNIGRRYGRTFECTIDGDRLTVTRRS